MLIYSTPSFGLHETPRGHAERPDRYRAVERSLKTPAFDHIERRDPPRATSEAIDRVHGSAYREMIEAAAPDAGLTQLDPDTFMGPASLDAALRAAGGGVAAVDAIIAGEATAAFIAARPPGHHAEPERAMGFCVFNNAVIAARHAQADHGLEKIAVVDFDVHHGNGTEAAFWSDEKAFFASSHEWPQYPGTGKSDDQGAHNNIYNVPLAHGASSLTFRRAWGDVILPALQAFCPEFIIISAGFDAHRADPLGGLDLDEDDFTWVTHAILEVATATCGGRVVSFLEGGYDLDALAASTASHVRALDDA
ncbi:MAG: histone deacetylase family protein [Pseudomonadota bacterium]